MGGIAMKRYLKDMDCKELLKLVNNNGALHHELWDYAMDTANFWIEDYLFGLGKGADDYRIDPCGYSYFNITRSGDYLPEFEEWIENAQKTYGFLSDEAYADVQKFLHYAMVLEHLKYVWCKDEDYDKVEELVETYMDKSEEHIARRLASEYDIKDVDLVDYIDDWMANNAYEEAYADADGHIYLHQPEIVIEAHEERIA